MTDIDAETLTTLVASRILHDLVSPLGAIGNGLELLEMAGVDGGGSETALIRESAAGATSRIELFRVAFGAAREGQIIDDRQLRAARAGIERSGRLSLDWQVDGAVSRVDGRLLFLAAMCLQTALPYGGTISARRGWEVTGESRDVRLSADLGAWLDGKGETLPEPAQVQFAMLALMGKSAGRQISWDMTDTRISLRF